MEQIDQKINLDEITSILQDIPGPDLEAATAARTHMPKNMGQLGEWLVWMATWQGNYPVRLRRPRVCLFAGAHGFDSGFAKILADHVEAYVQGRTALHKICQELDADLRVYDMGLPTTTRDFNTTPAMTREECARAMAYGMMAIEQGIDVVCLAGIGDPSGLSQQAIMDAVQKKSDLHKEECKTALDILRCFGGMEMAAIAGAILAARMGRVPVVLDGSAALCAALVLHHMDRRNLDHCQMVGSKDDVIVQMIGKTPMLDLGIDLQDGTQGAAALQQLKSAVAVG